MYSLVALLSLLVTAELLAVFAQRRRGLIPALAVTLAALLYTHVWGLFLATGCAFAVLVLFVLERRRAIILDALLSFGGALVLFAPWLPTLAYQAAHTAAPWSLAPTWRAIEQIPSVLLGAFPAVALALLAGAVGVVIAFRSDEQEEWRSLMLALSALLGSMIVAWSASKLSAAWASRYFAIFLGPLLLVLSGAFARLRGAAVLVTVALLAIWISGSSTPKLTFKSNVRPVAATVAPRLAAGDLVIETHPEELPVVYHYLHRVGLRYATTLGAVGDPSFMDWRDVLRRLRTHTTASTLEPLLASVRVGQRVALFVPSFVHAGQWLAPWTRLVRIRALQWDRVLARDRRFRRILAAPASGTGASSANPVRASVFVRVR